MAASKNAEICVFYLAKTPEQWRHWNNVRNMFKVKPITHLLTWQ